MLKYIATGLLALSMGCSTQRTLAEAHIGNKASSLDIHANGHANELNFFGRSHTIDDYHHVHHATAVDVGQEIWAGVGFVAGSRVALAERHREASPHLGISYMADLETGLGEFSLLGLATKDATPESAGEVFLFATYGSHYLGMMAEAAARRERDEQHYVFRFDVHPEIAFSNYELHVGPFFGMERNGSHAPEYNVGFTFGVGQKIVAPKSLKMR